MALAFSTSISGLRSPSARVAFRPVRSQQKARVAMTPRAAVQEVAEVAASGVTAFFGVAFLAIGASVASGKQIENRVDEETKKSEGYGIDLTDLFYDIDVPGDQYPFGDAEGMDFLPKSWKPPKIGDAKYLPTKMLGQISLRNRQYEVLQQCKAAGVDVDDLCVSFEGYEGEFDTNQKRYNEMRRRLEAAK